MKNKQWKPSTKKAEKLWSKILKEHKEFEELDLEFNKWLYTQYDHGFYYGDDNDPRKIVYMCDGTYITKDGIILEEEEREILEF